MILPVRVRLLCRGAAILVVAAAGACGPAAREGATGSVGSGSHSPGAAAAATEESAGRKSPGGVASSGTEAALSESDLRSRLAIFAHDSMQGRAAGTLGNFKATAYLAAELERLGLDPAGEDGTYFQTVPLTRRGFEQSSGLSVDDQELRAWTDYLPRDPGSTASAVEGAQVVYAGTWGARDLIPEAQARGKFVLVNAPLGASGRPEWAIAKTAVTTRFPGAVGIALVNLGGLPGEIITLLRQPQLELADDAAAPEHAALGDGSAQPLFVHVSAKAAEKMLGAPLAKTAPGKAGRKVSGRVAFAQGPPEAPARNVIAVLRGSDPELRGQYVAIGAHNDHVGITTPVDHDSLRAFNTVLRPGGAETQVLRPPNAEEAATVRAVLDSLRSVRPPRPDSISNGADDDGSGSVTVLEIAEAFVKGKERPKRSILFVWHTAEELGLHGARYFTDHPTVPRDSIVAQINIDMIGRGGEQDLAEGGSDYLQLIGSRRLSTELGDLVDAVNQRGGHRFRFDYQYDADGHPQNYYCRSDHYMYARYGIPIVFFTTGSHRDYHQVTDEPQYIEYDHLLRVGRLIHDVALNVANLDHRLVVDKPKPDPNAPCQQ